LSVAGSAVALSATLVLIARGAGRRVPGCAPGSGCDLVASSRWARLGRLPVTLPAAAIYAAMLACTVILPWASPRLVPALWQMLIALAVLVAAAATWFLALQALVVRRVCLYCVAAHAGALLAAAALVAAATIQPAHVSRPFSSVAALVGLAASILLACLQILIRPDLSQFTPTPASERRDDPNNDPNNDQNFLAATAAAAEPDFAPAPSSPPAAHASPPVPTRLMPSPRPLELLGGRLRFDASLFPLFGPPDARHIIADVSDYTCEHCRGLHPMLEDALAAMNGELAVLIFCAPLDRSCNPHIDIADPRYADACAYARLALGVWVSQAQAFASFHRWLMHGPRPPALENAQRRAAELIGDTSGERMSALLSGPHVRRQLADALTVFRLTGTSPLPRLLLPTGLLVGGSSSVEKLVVLLRDQLATSPATTVPTSSAVAPSMFAPSTPAPADVFSAQRID
jgi:uncharacterized membrane protein